MTMSPLSRGENVASRKGSGRHARSASRALHARPLRGQRGTENSGGRPDAPEVVREAQVATDDVLEEADGLGLDELLDHVGEDCADGVEALVGLFRENARSVRLPALPR